MNHCFHEGNGMKPCNTTYTVNNITEDYNTLLNVVNIDFIVFISMQIYCNNTLLFLAFKYLDLPCFMTIESFWGLTRFIPLM